MNKTILEELLYEVQKFNDKEKEISNDKEKRGENFNIFSILNVQNKEVKLHSALIAELLNSSGSHGMGNAFFKCFLETIESSWKNENGISNYKTQVELYTGQLTYDGVSSEGGRIDIILESRMSILVIENKIYASDQENQLIRYKNYCLSRNKSFNILYLTLDGSVPSEYSRGNQREDDDYYQYISYKYHILKWLELCAELAFDKPLIRETIKQYIQTVKKLTNMDFNFENTEKLFEFLDTPERIQSVGKLNQLWGGLKAYIIKNYLKDSLIKIANDHQLEVHIDDAFINLVGKPTGFYFTHKKWKEMAIYFWTENNSWTDFYLAISYQDVVKHENKIYTKLSCFNNDSTITCPYGWEYLKEEFNSWNDDFVLKIRNGEFSNYVNECLSKVLSEIKSNNNVILTNNFGIGGNSNDYIKIEM